MRKVFLTIFVSFVLQNVSFASDFDRPLVGLSRQSTVTFNLPKSWTRQTLSAYGNLTYPSLHVVLQNSEVISLGSYFDLQATASLKCVIYANTLEDGQDMWYDDNQMKNFVPNRDLKTTTGIGITDVEVGLDLSRNVISGKSTFSITASPYKISCNKSASTPVTFGEFAVALGRFATLNAVRKSDDLNPKVMIPPSAKLLISTSFPVQGIMRWPFDFATSDFITSDGCRLLSKYSRLPVTEKMEAKTVENRWLSDRSGAYSKLLVNYSDGANSIGLDCRRAAPQPITVEFIKNSLEKQNLNFSFVETQPTTESN